MRDPEPTADTFASSGRDAEPREERPGGVARLWRMARSTEARLLGCCIGGSLLLAVMTGPQGSNAEPTAGITGTFDDTKHWVAFLAFGIVLWTLMTLGRRARSGELAQVSVWLSRSGRAVRARWASLLLRNWSRRTLLFVALVVMLALGVLAADFTGPYHPDKLSWPQLRHQFVNAFTYGYLAIAVLLWRVVVTLALEQAGLTGTGWRPSRGARVVLVATGCVLGALLFALAANPWLPPGLAWSHVALVGRGTSIFGQWMTYAYLLAAAVIAWRLLRQAPSGPASSTTFRPVKSRAAQLGLSPTMALLALFLAIEAPRYMFSYWQSDLALQIGTYCLLAMGLNLVVGFCGLLDLGYVAFYAVGAYMAAYWTGALPVQPPIHLNLFVVLPIGIAAAMVAGVMLGLPTLRLRGDYLAIVTLVFGEIVEVVLTNWTNVTGGGSGTNYVNQFSINILGIHETWSNAVVLPYYYLMLGFVVVAIYVFQSVNRSRVGRRWSAIREDEVAAASLGVNPLKYKVMAFATGASTAGIAGVYTASNLGSLYPSSDTFGLQISILILALVLFGGMGSIYGVLAGAALFQWLQLELQLHSVFGYDQLDQYMWVGAMLIILMIFRPKGLFPSRQRSRELALARAGIGAADPMQVEHELAESAVVVE